MRGNVSEHSSKPLGGLFIHMVLDSTAETLKIQRKKQIKYKFTRNLSRQWVFCYGSSRQPHSRVSHSKFRRKCHWHSLFYKDHQNCIQKNCSLPLCLSFDACSTRNSLLRRLPLACHASSQSRSQAQLFRVLPTDF